LSGSQDNQTRTHLQGRININMYNLKLDIYILGILTFEFPV